MSCTDTVWSPVPNCGPPLRPPAIKTIPCASGAGWFMAWCWSCCWGSSPAPSSRRVAIISGQLKLPTTAGSDEPPAVCPAATFDYTPNEQINLNVYNSTSRPGLARTVADELLGRKFVVGAVANTEAGYRGVAAVVSGAAGQSAAFTVQRNVPGSDYFQDDRTDASVDVILAGDYKALAAADRVDQTPGTLSCPRESRRIADDSKWPVIPTAAATP